MAKSKTRWRTPLMAWKAKGQAARNLRAPLAAKGRAPNDAASDALSRCHPSSGAARYAVANTYRPPLKAEPVMRCHADPPNHVCCLS